MRTQNSRVFISAESVRAMVRDLEIGTLADVLLQEAVRDDRYVDDGHSRLLNLKGSQPVAPGKAQRHLGLASSNGPTPKAVAEPSAALCPRDPSARSA